MHWIARDDRTLALTGATPAARQAAMSALARLGEVQDEEAIELGESLIRGLRSGVLQAPVLVALGRLAHGQGPGREPARFASETLFGFLVPTPSVGLDSAYFWRVARRLETPPEPTRAKRQMRYKTFSRRPDACAYATELGERLVSITESQSGALLPVTTTLWFWEEGPG